MAHAENEITIDRPAAEVYAFLADGLNNTKWRPGVKDIALASGAAGAEGAVYSQTLTGLAAGLMKVLDGLITKTMQSEVAQLSSLKSAVEAG